MSAPSPARRVVDALDRLRAGADAEASERGDDVLAEGLCEAMERMVEIIGALGAALSPAKSDVLGNVNKVRRALEAKRDGLFASVRRAQEGRAHATSPAKGTLWLKRFGEFVCALLREVGETDASMRACSSAAYKRTLRRYHKRLTRTVFAAVLAFPPSRSSFVSNVGTREEMLELADNFEPILGRIDAFLTIENLNDPKPV